VVRLTIRGRTDEPVTVTAIRPIVVRRTAPMKGWYVASPTCGPEPIRIATIDLDRVPPSIAWFSNRGESLRDVAFSVTRTDLEIFEPHVFSARSTVDWKAQFFYSAPDGDGSVIVTDGGRPFRFTSERESAGFDITPDERGKIVLKREHSWDRTGIKAC
jgi:hypothetical protein